MMMIYELHENKAELIQQRASCCQPWIMDTDNKMISSIPEDTYFRKISKETV